MRSAKFAPDILIALHDQAPSAVAVASGCSPSNLLSSVCRGVVNSFLRRPCSSLSKVNLAGPSVCSAKFASDVPSALYDQAPVLRTCSFQFVEVSLFNF